MERKEILQAVASILEELPQNRLSEQVALRSELAGMQIFDAPLVKFGAAEDPLFPEYKKPEIIGPWFLTPEEWLPGAKTVISFFFPFTDAVKKSNRHRGEEPSDEWLHGRIEGQIFLNAFIDRLRAWFGEQGIAACTPMTDPRFLAVRNGDKFHEYGCVTERTFSSNWSERHIAYVCGLGTFGLSKGLITERGMAGRFTSIIICERIEPDTRPYSEVYEYCSRCGACVSRCPAKAIDLQTGKDHVTCRTHQLWISERHVPRYGCGLCQTGVPCESRIPVKRKSEE